MTKLANFDHTLAMAPVTGWYDTDDYDYTNLPPQADLLTLTEPQWDNRMTGFWNVQTGALVAAAPVSAPIYIPSAVVRTRLQTVGKWDAAAAAMTVGQMAWFCTLEYGVSPTDATVLALLTAIGADPADILAVPTER